MKTPSAIIAKTFTFSLRIQKIIQNVVRNESFMILVETIEESGKVLRGNETHVGALNEIITFKF